MQRTMTPTKQADAIWDFILGNNPNQVKHTEVLELVAKLNGAKSWNQLKKTKNTDSSGALVLEGEGGSDYRLKPGFSSAWVMAGNISVYIVKNDEGVFVDLFPLEKEACKPAASAHCSYQEAKDSGAKSFDLSKEKTPRPVKDKLALMQQACFELLTAYAWNAHGNSAIEWCDLDKAFETAKKALGLRCYKSLVAGCNSEV